MVAAERPVATVTSEIQFRHTSGTRLVELPVKLMHRTTTTTTTYPGGTVVQRVVVDLYEWVDLVHQHPAGNTEDLAASDRGLSPRKWSLRGRRMGRTSRSARGRGIPGRMASGTIARGSAGPTRRAPAPAPPRTAMRD